jgi:predicted short-subunit dehydrogenase-like oxidoreductase (DUF2520 family)
MNIVFIGSGNAATLLAKLMHAKGHTILQVWSRNAQHALRLAKKVGAETIQDLKNINPAADICVLAVSDIAIDEIARQLSLKRKILVHTAGAVSYDVLRGASPNYGVLYPLQSLNGEAEEIPEIPFLVDGNSDDVKVILLDFASTLSEHVKLADDRERLQLHLAAVIVNNFTNHLFALTEDFCNKYHLDFTLLHPLIQETAQRLKKRTAAELQTGPAKRGDSDTIQKHMQLLNDEPALLHLYQTISNSILGMYHKNKELRP